jgi:hypothetical protein
VQISAAEKDLKEATGIRTEEHEDFSATEKDLVETTDTLARAIIVLKRGQSSFLQRGSKAKTLPAHVDDLVPGTHDTFLRLSSLLAEPAAHPPLGLRTARKKTGRHETSRQRSLKM